MIIFYVVMGILTLMYASVIAEKNNTKLVKLMREAGKADWFNAQPNYQVVFWIAVCWPGYLVGLAYKYLTGGKTNG
jgi:hypothetical protein